MDEVIKDVTGEAMTAFFSKNTKTVNIVNDLMKEKQKVETRPLWKVLKEQGACDVQSIPEIEEVLLSPMEIARRKRAFNIFHQSYINDSWVDVLFMKMLCKNPTLLLPQCKESSYILYQISRKQYEIVRKFMVRCNPVPVSGRIFNPGLYFLSLAENVAVPQSAVSG